MNREEITRWDATRLRENMESGPWQTKWASLRHLVPDEPEWILKQICSLDPPKRINDLHVLETEQKTCGAGFYGMLPDQVPDELTVPNCVEAALDAAIQLAHVRESNLRAIREHVSQYPLHFSGTHYSPSVLQDVPTGWSLDVDVSGIQAILDAFDAGELQPDDALRIAQMSTFGEMLTHRRELGYIPEPLIDEEGFAWCLTHAASPDPVDQIWKWIHPHNLFDLSDLYTHRAEYQRLIDILSGKRGLASWVLPRLAPFAPTGVDFRDRFAFTVGWGIRGWATQKMGGLNIEHVKDDWDLLVPTLVHETYHRLQTKIAFANPDIDEEGFDRITSLPASVSVNRPLYQALAYIMLEGSATYVASAESSPAWETDATSGIALLEKLCALDDSEEAREASDALLNEGLKSNGPFYGFGALFSHAIVSQGETSHLSDALTRGAPFFVRQGLRLLQAPDLQPSERLRSSIESLSDAVKHIGT